MPAVNPAIPQVDYMRAELRDLLPRYNLIKDCVAGQAVIKKGEIKYLPKPNPADISETNRLRYADYVERAVFYNVTGRTLNGLVGQVFSKDPVATLPANLDVLKQDADGGGVSLDQLSKKALSYNIQFGRCGVLVDYPKTERPASVAELANGKIRPNITLWQPWDIINWRVVTVGGQKLLSLVVISEQAVLNDDGFAQECEQQYRVLRLVDGVYYVEIWKEAKDKSKFEVVEGPYTPTDAAGRVWNIIPFQFIGAENNDEIPDLPPLYDLATLNIAHYRNSADYEESCYMVGQPTPWASGLDKDWVETVLNGKFALGSRAVLPLPKDGQAGLLQADPNNMPAEAMKHKEAQMVALGAKLVEQRQVQQTATEAKNNNSSESSILSSCATNVSVALTQALKWAAAFVATTTEEIKYALSTDFEITRLTSAELAAVIAAWQANAIANSEMREYARRVGIATLDDDAYKTEIETAGPALGMPVNEEELKRQAEAAKAKAAVKPPAA